MKMAPTIRIIFNFLLGIIAYECIKTVKKKIVTTTAITIYIYQKLSKR